MPTVETAKNSSTWQAGMLRVTAFASAFDVATVDTWWETVVGAPAESKTVKMKGASQTIEGKFGKGRLTLNVELNRIDWLYGPDPDFERDDFPNIGTYADATTELNSRITTWIQTAPPIIRLAWGGVFLFPVESKVNSYEILAAHLPSLKLDSVGSSELLYQINRPRNSNVLEGLVINRLQKWSSLRIQRIHLQIAPGNQTVSNANAPGVDACRLELDVNSSGERVDPLPAESVSKLYAELTGFSDEIISRGDIP